VIGTFSASSYLHNDLNGRIIALVVSRKSRRHAIGARLIAAAEKDFTQRGITRVTLTTRFERAEAHRFYDKLGYARTGFRFAKNLISASG
jgi:ribosomal protein S18 acetylase RimI-like enzyme